MTDWSSERVRALVSAAENAVQRTRWIFLVLNLGCAIMITAQLNLYGPWVRHVRDRVNEKDADVLRTIDKILWDDLYNVSMPLLGIRYSADDIIVLGTAAMSVLALWFVYAHRRENHCIGALRDIAIDAKTKEPTLSAYIYAAVAHHFVFTTTTQNDETYGGEGTKTVLRWHVIFLIHLPWIASLMVVLVMAVSIFVPGLKLVPVTDTRVSAFFQFSRFAQFEAIARMAWGLACTLLTRYYCIQAQIYDRDTNEMLVEMQKSASDNQKPMKKAQRNKRTQRERQQGDDNALQGQEERL